MLAAFYDRQGAPADVFHVGEVPDPVPGEGEVRVRLTVSGVNPGDTKKRSGWLGNQMPFPRVIPHSDGAGVVEEARRAGPRGGGCRGCVDGWRRRPVSARGRRT
jgi:NADPH2:quinone reductase